MKFTVGQHPGQGRLTFAFDGGCVGFDFLAGLKKLLCQVVQGGR